MIKIVWLYRILELGLGIFLIFSYKNYKDNYDYSKKRGLMLIIPAIYLLLDIIVSFLRPHLLAAAPFFEVFSFLSPFMVGLILVFQFVEHSRWS